MSLSKREDIDPSTCAEKGNEFTVCSPLNTDIWYNGSTYNFVWNYNQPFYVPSKSISLYLYYKYNFAYTQIKEWTYMDTSDGEMSSLVDDTWFPDQLPAGSGNRTWTYFGYLLPADMNATKELITPSSTYPRPFNFSVVQFSLPLEAGASASTAVKAIPTNTNPNPTDTNNNSNDSSTNDSNNSGTALPTWAIVVISIVGAAVLAGVGVAIWAILISHRRKRTNKLSPTAAASTMAGQPRGGLGGGIGGGMSEKKLCRDSSSGQNSAEYEKRGLQGCDIASIYSNTPIMAMATGSGRLLASQPNSTTELASSINTAISSPRPLDPIHAVSISSPPFGPYHPNSTAYTMPPPPPRSPSTATTSTSTTTTNNNNTNTNSVLSSTDAAMLADTFRNALYRPEWSADGDEDEELKRRKLGESLLQRQLAEDGTSVKHTERRPTKIRTVAEIESRAILENIQPQSANI